MFKDEAEKESAYQELRQFMKASINTQKELRINDFIQFPLSSIQITESLLSDIYKVFDAGNSYFNIRTVKKKGGERIDELFEELDIVNWIEKNGKRALKSDPNLIVVIDKDENGKPYLIPVGSERLLDVQLNTDNITCDYISFLHSKGTENGKEWRKIAIYDETNYAVIHNEDGIYTLESIAPHNLGKCPARMFIDEPLNSTSEFNRKTPLTNALAKLKEWQLFDTYKFYTDHYAPFPVVEMVRAKCGNPDCVDGYITHTTFHEVNGITEPTNAVTKCAVCDTANSIGIGSKILVDPQTDKDQPTGAGKFRFISNETSNLTYLQNKLDRIENYIKGKVVGVDDIVVKEAVNEKQMEGAFESKTNVLLRIKTNLDELYLWIAESVGQMYAKDSPLTIEANFGTEWYLMSEDDIQDRLKTAIENDFPKEEIDMIYHQLIETKYKGNPEKVRRLKLINALDPMPYETHQHKKELYEMGIFTLTELVVSERLITFVNRFERENGSILYFGEEITEAERISRIVEQLNNYANESKQL